MSHSRLFEFSRVVLENWFIIKEDLHVIHIIAGLPQPGSCY